MVTLCNERQVEDRCVLQINNVHVTVLQVRLPCAPLGLVSQNHKQCSGIPLSNQRHGMLEKRRRWKAKVCVGFRQWLPGICTSSISSVPCSLQMCITTRGRLGDRVSRRASIRRASLWKHGWICMSCAMCPTAKYQYDCKKPPITVSQTT